MDDVLAAVEADVAALRELVLPPSELYLRWQTLQLRIMRLAVKMQRLSLETQRRATAKQRSLSPPALDVLRAEIKALEERNDRLAALRIEVERRIAEGPAS